MAEVIVICKPTVGETRECAVKGCIACRYAGKPMRVCINDCNFNAIPPQSRIVEVAPENRAPVTAGPAWMSAQ